MPRTFDGKNRYNLSLYSTVYCISNVLLSGKMSKFLLLLITELKRDVRIDEIYIGHPQKIPQETSL